MRKALCVYCAVRPGNTRDHVPPRALFPSPRPANLVTVPCCHSCRESQSADDEYLKNVIAIRQDVAEHPAAGQVLDSVHRALARPEYRAVTTALVRSAREVELRTGAGLYLGTATTFAVDLGRLDKVIRRTMLGLYWHEMKRRVPESHVAKVYCIDGVAGSALVAFNAAMDQALEGRPRVFGHKVFTYWFQRFADERDATLWAFLVYSRVAFLGFTGPLASSDAA